MSERRHASEPHPARFELERYSIGEMDDGAATAIYRHVGDCALCRGYLEELESAREALLERLPPAVFAARVVPAAPVERSPVRPWRPWAFAAAALGVAVLVTLGVLASWGETPPSEQRFMGAKTAVQTYVHRGGETQPFEGEAVRVGDQVRFRVVMAEDGVAYAAVLSIDDGTPSVVLPGGGADEPYALSGPSWLPHAVVVAPGGGAEELWVVVRAAPFRLPALLHEVGEALRRTAPGDPPFSFPGLEKRLALPSDAPPAGDSP